MSKVNNFHKKKIAKTNWNMIFKGKKQKGETNYTWSPVIKIVGPASVLRSPLGGFGNVASA